MVSVGFLDLDKVPDGMLEFVVIRARYRGEWIYVRHRERTTWETPGGHREQGEDLGTAAGRELFEETGALEFSMKPLCAYHMEVDGVKSYGGIFIAEVEMLGPLPESEIAEIKLCRNMPGNLTYPDIERFLPLEAGLPGIGG